MYFTKTTISAALVAAVNAHMKMTTPAPFDPEHLNNSPLDASGSDFPCKFGVGYSATGGTTNTYELGSSQELSFIGQAVHGGGSCQVVMTYDNPPTKDSQWKVIHSIEGGCPAKDTAGNLGNNADALDPFKYPFKIPSDIPTGKGVIGFTWFNRVGNREMYMNCGPLELTGTSGDKANFDKLPDMVVLNIGGKPTTPESVDYKFANPGQSIEDNTGKFGVATCGKDGCKNGDSAGGSGGSGGSPAGGSPASSATPSMPGGGVFLTTGTPDATAAPSSTVVFQTTPDATVVPSATATSIANSSAIPTSSAAATPTSVPVPTATPGSGSGSGSGSSGAMSGACTTEGMWNCIGGTSFQRCASGTWSAAMPMAAGTKCTPGQSSDLGMIAAGRKVRAFRA